jgi:hypothetical protein
MNKQKQQPNFQLSYSIKKFTDRFPKVFFILVLDNEIYVCIVVHCKWGGLSKRIKKRNSLLRREVCHSMMPSLKSASDFGSQINGLGDEKYFNVYLGTEAKGGGAELS